MSMNDKERLQCLIDHCNSVKEAYNGLINKHGSDTEKPENWFRPWDDFLDALEAIEEGMR